MRHSLYSAAEPRGCRAGRRRGRAANFYETTIPTLTNLRIIEEMLKSYLFDTVRSSTLLVASRADAASLNIANSLIFHSSDAWKVAETDRLWQATSSIGSCSSVYLWLQNLPLLKLNHPDIEFQKEFSAETKISDVIFLSKHVAASGISSLTVHPIGVPWQMDCSRSGGYPGRCSPPSFRIASLYRSLIVETKRRGIDDKYQITMEATHHGPHVDIPTCFVEIGSSQNEWSLKEAGDVWADLLMSHLGIRIRGESSGESDGSLPVLSCMTQQQKPSEQDSTGNCVKDVVMVCIGGGHYVPKMNDAARYGEGMYVGHSLTTYALQPYFEEPSPASAVDGGGASEDIEEGGVARDREEGGGVAAGKGEGGGEMRETQQAQKTAVLVPGGWQAVIREVIDSTRLTFPNAELICLVDKKAFTAGPKRQIISFIENEMKGVKWTHKMADVQRLYETCRGK